MKTVAAYVLSYLAALVTLTLPLTLGASVMWLCDQYFQIGWWPTFWVSMAALIPLTCIALTMPFVVVEWVLDALID